MPGDLPHNKIVVDTHEKGDGACMPDHAFLAFDTLYCALVSNAKPLASSAQVPDDEYPLFVTWNTVKRDGTTRLRGCIGTFTARPVRAGIAEYALVAAFRDHRFHKISKKELPTLECGISLLTDFEDTLSWDDWDIGTHGIYITFNRPSSRRFGIPNTDVLTATFLPQVAEEQGWTKEETLDSAIAKAGYGGPVDDAVRASIHVQRYQSRKCNVSWEEFAQWRNAYGESVEME